MTDNTNSTDSAKVAYRQIIKQIETAPCPYCAGQRDDLKRRFAEAEREWKQATMAYKEALEAAAKLRPDDFAPTRAVTAAGKNCARAYAVMTELEDKLTADDQLHR